MNEDKDTNLIAIESLIECIDNRDIAEGGIFLDDDNAEFVADILRYHYKSLTTENKMETVARLFGKELGEEFKVKSTIRNSYSATVVFTSSGLVISDAGPIVVSRMTILDDLLTGEAVIVDE